MKAFILHRVRSYVITSLLMFANIREVGVTPRSLSTLHILEEDPWAGWVQLACLTLWFNIMLCLKIKCLYKYLLHTTFWTESCMVVAICSMHPGDLSNLYRCKIRSSSEQNHKRCKKILTVQDILEQSTEVVLMSS